MYCERHKGCFALRQVNALKDISDDGIITRTRESHAEIGMSLGLNLAPIYNTY